MCYDGSITSLLSNIKPLLKGFSKTTRFWPLFLVVALVAANAALSSAATSSDFSRRQKLDAISSGLYGSIESTLGAILGSGTAAPAPGSSAPAASDAATLDGSLEGASVALADQLPARSGIVYYRSRKGDTLSGIAAKFGITLETLETANPKAKDPLPVWEKIAILPVSGALYTTSAGDTLMSVADRFGIDPELIKRYNPNYEQLFGKAGETVIVPNVDVGEISPPIVIGKR